MRVSLSAAALALALVPLLPARDAPGDVPPMTVLQATVAFARDGEAVLRMDGDLLANDALKAVDPLAGSVHVALGPVELLAGDGPSPGARLRRERGDRWTLDLRAPFGGRGRLTLQVDTGNGRFRLRARGFDGAALGALGPAGVPFTFSGDGFGGTDTFDFRVRGARRWEYRHVVVPIPPPGGGGGGGGDPIPPGLPTIAQGTSSLITGFRFEVVNDDASWQALWQAHGGAGAPPAVDFAAETVIGVWLGNRNSGGYSVDIYAVSPASIIGAPCTPEGGCPPMGAYVLFRETQPGPNCVVTDAITQPFHIVRVPRIDGPVLYEGEVVQRNCP